MNDITGVIMLCRRSVVSLWTLNGDLILEQNIHVEGDDLISTCAFYEGSGNEYLERNLIFTGHKKGVVNVCVCHALACTESQLTRTRYGASRYWKVNLF